MVTDTERRAAASRRARATVALFALLLLTAVAMALPAPAPAERASQPSSPASSRLDAGDRSSCAVLANGRVRCWGYGGEGEMGYGNRDTVGDDETPGSVGPVDLGAGRTATAISTGDYHSCALLDDASVRCWGFGGNGRLGYGNTDTIGDNETPGTVGPVDVGAGRTALAITSGGAHTCAVLDEGSVRCWGYGFYGQLGYGVFVENSSNNVGDTGPPGAVGPVDVGPGRTAKEITAGALHTCAVLDDGSVRCWGSGSNGQLGYGSRDNIGDDESPGPQTSVDLGPGRTAVAITAGNAHSCALLDEGSVRCWGSAGNGELGYGNTLNIGDDAGENPGSVGPVDLGPGRKAVAISAGGAHTCALLDDGNVRCWGFAGNGRLGYGNLTNIGDDETPGTVGPVDLGPGRKAVAISAGRTQTCARLDDGNVRCWGFAGNGRLGYCNPNNIGDDEAPGSVGPLALETPGPPCAGPDTGGGDGGSGITPGTGGDQTGGGGVVVPTPPAPGGRATVDPLASEALRAREMRRCIAAAKRVARSKRASARRSCLKRFGRTPGRVTTLKGRASSKTTIALSFRAPGTDGARPPAARAYLVKQSPRKIRGARDFARAQTLCKGRCRFKVTRVGTTIKLTITDLRPKTTYYYAIAARDNVSERLGPRSAAVKVKTR